MRKIRLKRRFYSDIRQKHIVFNNINLGSDLGLFP